MLFPVILILLAAGWRILGAHVPELANFAPLMALCLCGSIYFRGSKRMWAIPFVALILSDLYLDHYYATQFGESGTWPSLAVRAVCFGLAFPCGRLVARYKSWPNLLSGSLAMSLLFYFVTNTDAWMRDPAYLKTAAGWWQAMTIGRPEFPPTLWFFRNTFLSDLAFTGVFAMAMEYAARQSGAPSLFQRKLQEQLTSRA